MRRIYRLFRFEFPRFFGQMGISLIRGNDSLIAVYIRRMVYQTQSMIDTNVFIANNRNFIAGRGSALYHSCYILNRNGRLLLGNNSHLGAFCFVNVNYGEVQIGDDVAIGPGTKLFAYSNHYRRGMKVTNEKITQDIIIGNNVFIGANCTVLPGTVIQNNVVIGAGSVIKGELATNTIFAGAPCRKLSDGWYA